MPLPREPQRRSAEQHRKHLDAHEVPLERALLAVAEKTSEEMRRTREMNLPCTQADVYEIHAGVLRALAEELHYW